MPQTASPSRTRASFSTTIEPLESRITPSSAIAATFAATSPNEVIQHVAVDASGNIYVTGYFIGPVDFDPGPGVMKLTPTAGHINAFLAKYTGAGALAWVDQIESTTEDSNEVMLAVANNGDVFITSSFGQTNGASVKFIDVAHAGDPKLATQLGTLPELYLAKIDTNGDVVWTTTIGSSTALVTSPVIATDSHSNIYLGGVFGGASAGTLTIGTTTLNSGANSQNLFLAAFNDNGTAVPLYANSPTLSGATPTASFSNLSLTVDSNGVATIAASLSGSVNFQVSTPVTVASTDFQDPVVAQMGAGGSWNFALGIPNGGASGITHVAADGLGNVYVAGTFSGSVNIAGTALTSAGSTDAFFLKLDSSGNNLNLKQYGGSGTDAAELLTVDPNHNVYLGISFQGTVNFAPGQGAVNIASLGTTGLGIVALDSSGGFNGVTNLAATRIPSGSGIVVDISQPGHDVDMAVDSSGAVYLIGAFSHSVNFTPGTTGGTLSTSGTSGFVAHYLPNGLLPQQPQQPIFQQGFSLTGTGTEVGYDVLTDASGNVYIAGLFTGTVDFDPGPGVTKLTSTNSVGNIFVAKYDSAGDLLWARQVGMGLSLHGTTPNLDIHLALDSSGDVFLSGEYEGTATLGTFTLQNADSGTGANGRDIFVAKLNSAGTFQWADTIGAAGSDEIVQSMAVNSSSGQVVLGGTFTNTVDFDPGPGTTTLTPTNGTSSLADGYIVSLDTGGNFQWVHQLGGTGATIDVFGLAFLSTGDVVATGDFSSTVDFGLGGTASPQTSLTSYEAAYVARFTGTSGTVVWHQGYGGDQEVAGLAIAVSPTDQIFVGGQFHGSVTFNPSSNGTPIVETGSSPTTGGGSPSVGGGDAFLLSVDSNGNYVNAVGFGGAGIDMARFVSVDANGSVFVGGTFSGTADFDPGAGIAKLTAGGGGGVFVSQLNATNLGFINAFKFDATNSMGTIPGTGLDTATGLSIYVDQNDNTFLTGGYTGTANLDPATKGASFTNTSKTVDSLLLAHLTPAFDADANHPRSFHNSEGDTVTITVSGPGTVQYSLVGGVGDMNDLDTATLAGTTLKTGIKFGFSAVPGGDGTGLINHIVTSQAVQNVGSITLDSAFLLGDGNSDAIPELHVSGEMNSLTLGNLNSNALIRLGDGLPYHIPGNTGQPDTYNNHPNLTIGDITGGGVEIDVIGDGVTAGGVGGGGLGTVIVHSWAFTGLLQTTQGIGSFTVQTGDFYGTLLLDPNHLGEYTTANIGSMTVANGAWGGTGTEVEGNVGSFSATAFLAGASIQAASIGSVHTSSGDFAGTLTLTSATAATSGTFTVASDFSGVVISSQSLKKINIRGNFKGSLQAPGIAGITAFAFLGDAPTTPGVYPDYIKATTGYLGVLKATSGIIQNYSISTPAQFGGFAVNISQITADTVGLDHIDVTAGSIGNISVTLAAAKSASGVHLTGLDTVNLTTTYTGTKKLAGSIGNVTVTLKGMAGVVGATGISNSNFDSRVLLNEFGTNPASTANPLGNIGVTITGAGGASLGLWNDTFTGNSIGKTTVNVTQGKTVGATATAVDTVSYSADSAINTITIGGDATSAQVTGLDVWAGGVVGAINIKAKTAANGSLINSAILAGQDLTLTGSTTKALTAALKGAALGAVSVSGAMTNSQLVAGSNIGAITVGGAVSGSNILAGALLGADHTLGGGDDSYQRAASIAAVTVKGQFGSSVISAGISPVAGGFGDADDVLAPAAGILTTSSSIGAIKLGVGTLPGTAPTLPHSAVIQAAAIKSLSVPHAKTVADFSSPVLIDLTGDGETADDVVARVVA